MIEDELAQYMKIIDHLSTAKSYLDKTDAWLGTEIHVIIEKVKKRAGDQAYSVARKQWIDMERVGG
jgi:hypothetical protein